MKEREIYVTALDVERLRKLLDGVKLWSSRDREHLEALGAELDRAHVVAPQDVPSDVVTMNWSLVVVATARIPNCAASLRPRAGRDAG